MLSWKLVRMEFIKTEWLSFKIAGFTNITHDHLDYHKTFLEYLNVKKRFFDELPETAVAITNIDDKNGNVMTTNPYFEEVVR